MYPPRRDVRRAQQAEGNREQDRQRFVDYVRSEPLAAAQLRAPLYEDKVVDFLFDKAEVTEREVTREELQAAIEAEEGAAAAPTEAKPAKKKAAKKADAEGEAAGEAEEAKPAKKAPAKKKAAAEGEAEAPAAEGEAKPAAKKKAAKKAPAEGEEA